MMSFSLWDIVRNLLIGGALTLLLSLVAFVLGGATGLLVLLARIIPAFLHPVYCSMAFSVAAASVAPHASSCASQRT